MKTKTLMALVAGGFLTVTLGSGSSARARSNDLVNQALDKTLNEHALVEHSYEQAIDRPSDGIRAKDERKIKVVMDGEIGGKGGGFRLKDSDRDDHSFHEKNVEAKLDKEVLDIDKSLELQAKAERLNARERDVRVTAKRSKSRE